MEEQNKIHVHLSGLIARARQQKGFSTLKEFYREKNPSIDYQSWLHIESGRRIPAPETLVLMGDLLDIAREDLIIAYCKDKFEDILSHKVLEAFQAKGLFDVGTLMQAKDHDRSNDYVFSTEQVKAMQQDPRLRLYLMYTYDRESNTTLLRLANFFGVDQSEVQEVVEHLQALGLLEVIGNQVKKIHLHTTVPITADISELRKQLLIKSLDLNIKAESYISNYHVNLSEKSYKKILGLFDFIEANLIKMEKEDQNDLNSFRFQIAMAGNKLSEGSDDDRKQQSVD